MMISPNEKTIAEVLKLLQERKTPSELARKYHVARSSIYRGINERAEHDVKTVTKLSERDYHLMLNKMERLEKESDIYNTCSCSKFSPLEEKFEEITRLKGKCGIHALCRVLNVNRSAYYHHLLRSPEKIQIELEDKNLRPMIKEILKKAANAIE